MLCRYYKEWIHFMFMCSQIKNGLAFLLIIHMDYSHNLYGWLRYHCTWNQVIWWRIDIPIHHSNCPSLIFSVVLPDPNSITVPSLACCIWGVCMCVCVCVCCPLPSEYKISTWASVASKLRALTRYKYSAR